eukprot:TRINITY_DN536_c0_g1_i3.p1 TRINITY_DN536_c0_g1~~TRINITY_DN536_c0_g1_i3.p1  ORF type:complete len:528 (+),score=62.05 TRINITY_DN536_c0_g1_i3:141-1724(+)
MICKLAQQILPADMGKHRLDRDLRQPGRVWLQQDPEMALYRRDRAEEGDLYQQDQEWCQLVQEGVGLYQLAQEEVGLHQLAPEWCQLVQEGVGLYQLAQEEVGLHQLAPEWCQLVQEEVGFVSTGPGRGGFVSTGPGMVSTGPGAAWNKPKMAERSGNGIDGMATATPDGRDIKVNGVPCAYCSKMIVGRVTNALGKKWHPDHFVCETCSQPFKDGKFIEHQGKPYCEDHFYELFAPRCTRCKQPVKTGCIHALDLDWHPEHFTCQGCGVSLVGAVYKEAGGEPFCKKCHEDMVIVVDAEIHICSMCKKPIIGEYIMLKGQYIHPEHFDCAACGKKLTNGNCFQHKGKYYCKEDYDKLQIDTCAGCSKPIIGRSCTAMGRVWHPEHFCCTVCHAPFNGRSFYQKDGKPYCEEHFKMVAGKLCARCNEAVIDGIETAGKIWHKECFACQGCDKPIKVGTKLFEYQSKPMCRKCYLKLPSKVRKELEKKETQEKKMEKKRRKEQSKEAKKRSKEAKKRTKEAKKNSKNF